MSILGVIGGMGPQASVQFYQTITDLEKAECDQDHMDILIMSHATMPDRSTAILSGDTEEVTSKLVADAKMLEKNGCCAVAITCNTAHYFVPEIEKEINIPVISMISAASDRALRYLIGKPGKVAVLATDGTIKSELYQKALLSRGIEPYVPDETIQKLVMHEIFDCIKAGKPADRFAWANIDNAIKEAGCDCAILACTELSVLKQELSVGSLYIDAMEELALACIEYVEKQKEQE